MTKVNWWGKSLTVKVNACAVLISYFAFSDVRDYRGRLVVD